MQKLLYHMIKHCMDRRACNQIGTAATSLYTSSLSCLYIILYYICIYNIFLNQTCNTSYISVWPDNCSSQLCSLCMARETTHHYFKNRTDETNCFFLKHNCHFSLASYFMLHYHGPWISILLGTFGKSAVVWYIEEQLKLTGYYNTWVYNLCEEFQASSHLN